MQTTVIEQQLKKKKKEKDDQLEVRLVARNQPPSEMAMVMSVVSTAFSVWNLAVAIKILHMHIFLPAAPLLG